MGMSIDKAIKQLETYTIPCGKYKEAYDLAIETMRKYQKITEILNNDSYYEDYGSSAEAFVVSAISEVVIEDGKID